MKPEKDGFDGGCNFPQKDPGPVRYEERFFLAENALQILQDSILF